MIDLHQCCLLQAPSRPSAIRTRQDSTCDCFPGRNPHGDYHESILTTRTLIRVITASSSSRSRKRSRPKRLPDRSVGIAERAPTIDDQACLQCIYCNHVRRPRDPKHDRTPTCDAFPEGIPTPIVMGRPRPHNALSGRSRHPVRTDMNRMPKVDRSLTADSPAMAGFMRIHFSDIPGEVPPILRLSDAFSLERCTETPRSIASGQKSSRMEP